jgi:hypothetical protein
VRLFCFHNCGLACGLFLHAFFFIYEGLIIPLIEE